MTKANVSILLVEDNFLNRRLIKKVLETNAYVVVGAHDPNTAMTSLESHKFDVVILDINLEDDEMDGIGLASIINIKYKTPIIFLTAYDAPQVVGRALSTTPSGYLTKPFKNIDLLAAVEIALKNNTKKDQGRPATILIKNEDHFIDIAIEDIDYIESQGNYLYFSINEKKYKHRSTIKLIKEILPESSFIQTHRAFIINKMKIKKYNQKSICIGQAIIPITKNYIDDLALLTIHS